jgi:hypothetical protein
VTGSSLFNTATSSASSGSSFGSISDAGAGTGTTIPLWRETTPYKDNKTPYTLYEPADKSPGLFNVPGKWSATQKVPADQALAQQVTADQASLQFGYILTNPDLLAQWQKLALSSGQVTAANVNDAATLGKAWDTAVGWAVNIKSATGGATEMTPFEAAAMVGQNSGSALLAQQTDAAAHFTGNKIT